MNESEALRWRIWLELELEAVWLYPVIGARFDALHAAATAAHEEHSDLRDALVSVLADADIEPPGPLVSYEVGDLDSVEDAQDVAAGLEQRLCASIAALTGEVDGEERERVVRELRATAVRAASWGAAPQPFPGLG
ncbi:hypothetical protein BHE97_14910 [Aeromicrobium sp. PE09-221]|uniref:DUF4439 domain-containing protein n=1 Tax=Aeromicrobium sp. PE09-221 TaxID=1898043 RepID=UPI000B3E7E32|nr:DUF4439 domain-containing protein [Aeromicrobium sp. PE09-221]OUZ07987.1 hypothetical protein BHE97_14910 [Aeromicrobium sp. PE09-221]